MRQFFFAYGRTFLLNDPSDAARYVIKFLKINLLKTNCILS